MAIEIQELEIPDVKIFAPAKHADKRGFFSETWNLAALSEAGLDLDFVQDNHSFSVDRGVIRGLHFQTPPFAQDKLIRVISGAILDIAVDIRHGSPSFGKHVSAVISADNWQQILVPKGFAHGLCTIEPNTAVLYKVTAPYAPNHDKGILWNDPALAIEWPMAEVDAILSDRDTKHPLLAHMAPAFFYS